MKVNINKSNVMSSGESDKGVQNTGRSPCSGCGRDIGRNSTQCTNC